MKGNIQTKIGHGLQKNLIELQKI